MKQALSGGDLSALMSPGIPEVASPPSHAPKEKKGVKFATSVEVFDVYGIPYKLYKKEIDAICLIKSYVYHFRIISVLG